MDYLFPYQKKILSDVLNQQYKRIILEKSRRIGGTFIMAIAAVAYAMKYNQNVWFSSLDEKDGQEFIAYVTAWCELLNKVQGPIFPLKHATSTCVLMPNRYRITCLSSSPKVFRGKDGLCIWDEAAYHDHSKELYSSLVGATAQKGKIVILSTHNGPGTLFYDIATNNEKYGYRKHRVTMADACREGYAKRFVKHLGHLSGQELINEYLKELRTAALSEDVFKQEFCCEPLSTASLIPPALYDKMALFDVPEFLDFDNIYRDLFMGIDIAVVNDMSVITVWERYDEPTPKSSYERYNYKMVAQKAIKGMSSSNQETIIAQYLSHPSMRRALIDQGTVGYELSKSLEEKFGGIIEGFGFSRSNKAIMAERMKGFLEQERVNVPKDKMAREDFLALKRTYKNSFTLTYDGSTSFSHCDYFWSSALGLHAAEEDNSAIELVANN